MTLRRPHNMLALLLVLMMSLIINPVFAMPGYQAVSILSVSHNTVHDVTQSDNANHANGHATHNAGHDSGQQSSPHAINEAKINQEMLHCNDCVDENMTDAKHCGNDGDNSHCKSCNNSHCQYSALPVFLHAQANLSEQDAPQRLLVNAPISRAENSLRPPIH